MATPHVRYQLHLHGPQIGPGRRQWGWVLLLGLLLAAGPALAQRKRGDAIDRSRKGRIKGITIENLSNYNDRFFRPGMYVGLDYSRFYIEQSEAYLRAVQQGKGIAANAVVSPGFGVGFIGDIRLGNPSTPFHLRFAPGVRFATRRVEFEGRGAGMPDTIRTQEVASTQLELPLLLKYQSDRRRNTRVYMIAGIKPSFAVTQRQNTPAINQIGVTGSDLLLEYGVGLDLFYPYFKFAPELRFSHGMRNILDPRNNTYSNALQSLRTNSVTLYFNIE